MKHSNSGAVIKLGNQKMPSLEYVFYLNPYMALIQLSHLVSYYLSDKFYLCECQILICYQNADLTAFRIVNCYLRLHLFECLTEVQMNSKVNDWHLPWLAFIWLFENHVNSFWLKLVNSVIASSLFSPIVYIGCCILPIIFKKIILKFQKQVT